MHTLWSISAPAYWKCELQNPDQIIYFKNTLYTLLCALKLEGRFKHDNLIFLVILKEPLHLSFNVPLYFCQSVLLGPWDVYNVAFPRKTPALLPPGQPAALPVRSTRNIAAWQPSVNYQHPSSTHTHTHCLHIFALWVTTPCQSSCV